MPPCRRRLLAAAPLLLLLGCAADDPSPPPARTAAAAAAAAARAATPVAAVPAGPVTRFDGTYRGTITLNPDRTRACRKREGGDEQVEITVRQGRASFLVDRQARQTLSGTIGQDGSVRLADIVDRTIATSGVFENDAFVGEHRNGLCSYAVNVRREG